MNVAMFKESKGVGPEQAAVVEERKGAHDLLTPLMKSESSMYGTEMRSRADSTPRNPLPYSPMRKILRETLNKPNDETPARSILRELFNAVDYSKLQVEEEKKGLDSDSSISAASLDDAEEQPLDEEVVEGLAEMAPSVYEDRMGTI